MSVTTAPTVLGIGNPLMGDDGVGIALLEELMALDPDPRIEYVDGGTIGLSLLPLVLDAQSLLVLDAVAAPVPGTVVHLSGDQLPRLLQMKLSPHQVGLLDVLASARLLGCEPARIAVVGIAPKLVDMRLGLSPDVRAAVPEALALVRDVLRGWLRSEAGVSTVPTGRSPGGGQSCSATSTST